MVTDFRWVGGAGSEIALTFFMVGFGFGRRRAMGMSSVGRIILTALRRSSGGLSNTGMFRLATVLTVGTISRRFNSPLAALAVDRW
mmetsp:Transcript_21588/g.38551  ORF Transcript_21588/g.38551 Transcript_21588/m.38551 type:complete len:86 (-) Transcript_21588:526-783(-)